MPQAGSRGWYWRAPGLRTAATEEADFSKYNGDEGGRQGQTDKVIRRCETTSLCCVERSANKKKLINHLDKTAEWMAPAAKIQRQI